MGGVPGPFDSFLTLRGIKTLALRMERHCANALAIAQFLEQHPKVERVLLSRARRAIRSMRSRRRQMTGGYGGIVTAVLRGGRSTMRAGCSSAASCSRSRRAWAASRASSSIPALMTHASLPAAMRASLGISDGLIRLSVGVEDAHDLIAELKEALG